MNAQDFIDNGCTQEQYQMFLKQQNNNQNSQLNDFLQEQNYQEANSLQHRYQNDSQIQRRKKNNNIEKSTRTASQSNSLRKFDINENYQNLKLRQSTDSILQNAQSQISEHNASQVFIQALEPQNIFDLPQALLYIQNLIQQIQDLQQNIQEQKNEQINVFEQMKSQQMENEKYQIEHIDQQERQIQLEQQIFQLVDQRSNLRRQLHQLKKNKQQNESIIDGFEDIENINDQTDINKYFINELQLQIKGLENDNFQIKESYQTLQTQICQLQEIIQSKNEKIEQLENINLNKQIQQYEGMSEQQNAISSQCELEAQTKKIKQKYKSKIIEKQKEIDLIRVHEAERERWLQVQYNHIQVLSSQVEQAWRIMISKLDSQLKNNNLTDSNILTSQLPNNENDNSWIPQDFKESIKSHQHKPSNEMIKEFEINGSFGNGNTANSYEAKLQLQDQILDKNSSQELREELMQSKTLIQQPSQKSQLTHSEKQNNSIIEDKQDYVEDNISETNLDQSLVAEPKQQQQQTPTINMHMSLEPVAKEVEKLRDIITNLSDHLVNTFSKTNLHNQEIQNQINVQNLANEIKQAFQYQPQQNLQLFELQQINSEIKLQNSKLQIKLTEQKQQFNEIENKLNFQIEKYNKELQDIQSQNQLQNQELNLQIIKKNKQTQKQLKQTIRKLEDELMKEKINTSRTELLGKQTILESTNKYELQLKNMRQCLGFMLGKAAINKENAPKWLYEKLKLNYEQLLLTLNNQELLKSMKAFDDRIDLLHSQAHFNNIEEQQDENLVRENKQLIAALGCEQKLRRTLLNQLQALKGNVRVICRIKPIFKNEKQLKQLDFNVIGNNKLQFHNSNSGQKKLFHFDQIFDSKSQQSEIFQEIEQLIHSSLDGYNVCIMSYGQTGSGKTFTMVGNDQNPGLYFTAVEEINRQIKLNKKSNIEFDMSVSAIEIYNEEIRDLLSKDQSQNRLKLFEDQDGYVYSTQVKRKVTGKNHILQSLRDACFNRTVGVTQFNDYSSRSHFILTIYITKYNRLSKEIHQGKLSLVDLAGSERILRTNAEGIRIREAQNINRSLTSLGNVFLNLSNNSSHIPYRDSNLTHYLKDSIGGNSKLMMILQVSQLEKDIGETVSTLVFGQRIQQIQKGALSAQVQRRSNTRSIHRQKNSKQIQSQRINLKNNSRSCISFNSNKLTDNGNKSLISLNGIYNNQQIISKSLSKIKQAQKQRTEHNSFTRFNNQQLLISNSMYNESKSKSKKSKLDKKPKKQNKRNILQDDIQLEFSNQLKKNENLGSNLDTTISKSVLKQKNELKNISKASSRPLQIQDLTTSIQRKRMQNYSPQTYIKEPQKIQINQNTQPNFINQNTFEQTQDQSMYEQQNKNTVSQSPDEKQIININAVGQHFQSQSASDLENNSENKQESQHIHKGCQENGNQQSQNLASTKSIQTSSQIDQKYYQLNTQNTVSQRSFLSHKLMNEQSSRILKEQSKQQTQNYTKSIFEIPDTQTVKLANYKQYDPIQETSDMSSRKSLKSNSYVQQKFTKYSTQLNSEYEDRNDENNSKSINQTLQKSPSQNYKGKYQNENLKDDVFNSYYQKEQKHYLNNGIQKEHLNIINNSQNKQDNLKSSYSKIKIMNDDIFNNNSNQNIQNQNYERQLIIKNIQQPQKQQRNCNPLVEQLPKQKKLISKFDYLSSSNEQNLESSQQSSDMQMNNLTGQFSQLMPRQMHAQKQELNQIIKQKCDNKDYLQNDSYEQYSKIGDLQMVNKQQLLGELEYVKKMLQNIDNQIYTKGIQNNHKFSQK